MWAGDNVLWELRGPGADSVPVARLEDGTATGVEFGAVGYTHAGGVDRPLEAWKGTGAAPVMVVVPHVNWRGLFSGGTYLTGNVTTHPIVWPGLITTAWHQNQPSQQETKVWTGSLLEGQRDASGQMYMRNRYYDPATGQFTQTDPSGLAGGMNAYGFAAGDPVSYSDPYGLSADDQCKTGGSEKCPIKLDPVVVTGTPNSKHHGRCEVAGFLSKYVGRLGNPTTFIDGSYPAELDTKYINRGDMFQVGDEWLRADEFGNYAAGYAGQWAYVEAGHLAMLAGGVAYAATRREEHWSDRESRPMINAGAARARAEQTFDGRTRGMRGIGPINTPYLEPLTSTANCK